MYLALFSFLRQLSLNPLELFQFEIHRDLGLLQEKHDPRLRPKSTATHLYLANQRARSKFQTRDAYWSTLFQQLIEPRMRLRFVLPEWQRHRWYRTTCCVRILCTNCRLFSSGSVRKWQSHIFVRHQRCLFHSGRANCNRVRRSISYWKRFAQ